MENKILKVLLVLIVVIMGATAVYFNLTTEVPSLKTELKDGSIVLATDIEDTRMLKSQIPSNTFADGKEMVGKEVQGTIAAGIPVLKEQLKDIEKPSAVSDEVIAIVPIPVDSTHVPSKIKEGDLVNVIVFFAENEKIAQEAFAIGYDYIATVNRITKDADGNIVRVDIVCDKELAVDLAASISLGDVFIIQNEDINDIELKGTTAKDLFEKYYKRDQGEIVDIETENTEVEGEGE